MSSPVPDPLPRRTRVSVRSPLRLTTGQGCKSGISSLSRHCYCSMNEPGANRSCRRGAGYGRAMAPSSSLASPRGAKVEADPHSVVRVLAGIGLAGMLVASLALFVAGARHNAQVSELQHHGIPVDITVTGCLGLLGGSGSNAAGYACNGTYTLGGRRYYAHLPGSFLRAPGTELAGVASRFDPRLVATRTALAGQRPSARVYLLPSVLAALIAITLACAGWRRATRRRSSPMARAGGTRAER
jgi:hypothetical protein